MMDLDSAIQHCQEKVQEQAKKGCYGCVEEHHQLAEWLKELKAYRENTCGDAISRQAAIEEIRFGQSFITKIHPTGEIEHLFDKENKALEDAVERIKALPSVTPQQRTDAEVLDKIRAEIMDFEEELFHRPNTDYSDYAAVRHCVEIIDKYKAESEVEG